MDSIYNVPIDEDKPIPRASKDAIRCKSRRQAWLEASEMHTRNAIRIDRATQQRQARRERRRK